MDDTQLKKGKAPPRFHTKGVAWHYSDGTVLVIGKDGAARRAEPKVKMNKKQRRQHRQAAKEATAKTMNKD